VQFFRTILSGFPCSVKPEIMAGGIITGNVRDFRNSKVVAFTPSAFIVRL